MKFRLVFTVGALCTFMAGAFAQTSTYVTYKYAKVDYPGAASTSANAINKSNVIVGTYSDAAGNSHGFKHASGKYTTIDVPNSSSTEALGINDFGDIVGSYVLKSDPSFQNHGFLLHNGTFSTVDYPGSPGGTVATGINNSGAIVGNFGNSRGFIHQNGAFRAIDGPVAPGTTPYTQLYGINNLGQVAGDIEWVDAFRGIWGPSTGSDFDFLSAQLVPDNQVNGINGRGDIVGCTGLSSFIAFHVESSEASESTEKFPSLEILPNPIDPTDSCVNGINYARVIVGIAGFQGNSHGFMAIPALTLNVTAPVNGSTHSNPVHVAASASGLNPISQIQVWVNSKEIYHVSGGSVSAYIKLPVGSNERMVIQALDSKGVIAKVVDKVTVK
jgi:hypothetical protein